jgi:hypothetical protein
MIFCFPFKIKPGLKDHNKIGFGNFSHQWTVWAFRLAERRSSPKVLKQSSIWNRTVLELEGRSGREIA